MFNQFKPALALLALPALVAAAPVNDLAHVQNHLRAVESMTATFTQT
ncbi:cell envelope biogenesis protein LolA, partial [Pseudomonas sp. FW305-130]